MGDFGGLAVAVVLLALNAFFVGAEFALLSARRSQIEPRVQEGSRLAKIALGAMERISLMMAGAQLGITICSLGLGAVGEPAVAHLLEPLLAAVYIPTALVHPISFVIALTIVVILHVILGEMVPKNIALAGPERSALLLAPPLVAIVTVLRPLIAAINWIANTFLRMMKIRPKDEVTSAFTRAEVAALVEESRGEGLLEKDEYDRLAGALGFTERDVSDVVLPLSELSTIAPGATVAEVEGLCADTGYSRFPVATDDNLLGYLHIKDILSVEESRRTEPIADKWIRPLATVTPGAQLHDALETLQRKGAHMARVVTPEGELRGVATLEDVLEELVGEIRDASHWETPQGPSMTKFAR